MHKTGRRRWQRLLIFALGSVGVAVLGVLLYLGHIGAMTYLHPGRVTRSPGDTPARFGVAYRDVTLVTTDGVSLSAWYTAPKNGTVILVAHGYGVIRSAEMHAVFARHGFGVLSWDARAHGESGGDFSTVGYLETLDVESALDYALQQDGVRRVGAYGQSMGAAAIIRAAARRPQIAAVVADSPYATLDEMLRKLVPYPLLHPFIRFFVVRETGIPIQAMRPIDDIGRISPRPILLIQCTSDDVVPLEAAQKLYASAAEPRTLWIADGKGHVGVRAADPAAYDRRVLAFFDGYLNDDR